jgi:3-isopropylmalate/(R)-2-methylmalate dehydratase small subunit
MRPITGKALKYGDNVDTDTIIPSKFLVLRNPEEFGAHAMEGLDKQFPQKVKSCGILVAGKNFGCGSSREQAPLALKYAGVHCIVAESFARIFYRNAINIGLPVLECHGAHSETDNGDDLKIILSKGVIINKTKNKTYQGTRLPRFLLKILESGGLIEYLNKKG